MSCEECEKIQDLAFNKNIAKSCPIAYIRVDKSNLALVGCQVHIKMAIDKINSETSHNKDFKAHQETMIDKISKDYKGYSDSPKDFCPQCNSNLIESKTMWQCSKEDCLFTRDKNPS